MPEIDASNPTEATPYRRKLIAVVHADMVGYSRLIGLDDVGTLARLRTLRKSLIDPAIEEYGGRIVNTGGDSLLIVFDSIDGAVRCAVKVQQQVPVHDGGQPADRTIRFRVGINVGDVIPDGTDVHGDVVNVAARLQAECPLGGICVSRQVRDHVQDRLDLAFDELGELTLKNIARPVEAFVLRVDTTGMMARSTHRPLAHTPREAPSLPDRPSIAVLAFANLSGTTEDYLSDGLADTIIVELSRNRSLLVIARTSSFTYKGRSTPVKQVARELGVRYVVDGTFRQSGNRIRITAELIDAETGSHIWAERFDRDLADLFIVQDEITRAMVEAINPAISQAERQRAMRTPPENLGAWEAWQRALWHWPKGGELATMRSFLQRAMALDPRFAPPHAIEAILYLAEATRGFGPPPKEAAKLAEVEARTAIELDPESALGHAALGWVLHNQSDPRLALEEAETAITLNPNEPWGHLCKGHVLVFSGQPAEAREPLRVALRLDPYGPAARIALHDGTIGFYFEWNYPAAETTVRRAISAYPRFPRLYPWLAAALGQIGRLDEAHSALDAAITISPTYFKFITGSPPSYYRPGDHEHLLEGLRKAGWDG